MQNTISINILDKEFKIKRSYRALMMFEERTEKGLDEMDNTITDIVTLLYCILVANNKSFTYSFDEFVDILDDNENILEDFNAYILNLASDSKSIDTDKKKG